jgi:ribosome-binding factor A
VPSHRIEQVDELLRRELNRILQRTVEFPSGCLCTIEDVTTSHDMSQANVAVSVYPISCRSQAFRILREAQREIQRELVQRIMRRTVPKIIFHIDEREERADRINRILDG